MSESVRAFLAIELPEDVKGALAVLVKQLTQARISGLRPIMPEGIHLTIRFLGNVEIAQLDLITKQIACTARYHQPFRLELGEVGVFPNNRNPRVLWIGIEGDIKPLRELHMQTENTLEEIGFAREKRLFSPHLTVARIGDRTSLTEKRRAIEILFSAEFHSGKSIPVSSLSLMRSILRAEGARYERLARFPLAGAVSEGYANTNYT